MRLLAIDPGPRESAFLVLENGRICEFGKTLNSRLISYLWVGAPEHTHLVIEMIASYGMAVGVEVFETCVWIGRFTEAGGPRVGYVYRKQVALHLCQSPRAKDSNVRAALIDRFGPPGTKRAPGATYGISKDVWSALAVAVTYADQSKDLVSLTKGDLPLR
jgi:hypothetical protein